MAGLAWKWPRTRLPVGASALGVFVLCWLYVFPVYRLPDEKEIVQGVLLQQGKAWRRNHTAVAGFRYRRLKGGRGRAAPRRPKLGAVHPLLPPPARPRPLLPRQTFVGGSPRAERPKGRAAAGCPCGREGFPGAPGLKGGAEEICLPPKPARAAG